MPKKSEELAGVRYKEIVDACAKLYKTMSFKEITMTEIGKATSFTRASIYNYFQTKEEIFLALLQREYAAWNKELSAAGKMKEPLTREELAILLADTLSRRKQMLKILAMNMYEIEENAGLERLVEFKREYCATIDSLNAALQRVRPKMSDAACEQFLYSFLPLAHGLYPYTNATAKQKKAMACAGLSWPSLSIRDMTLMAARNLLKV